MLSQICYCKVLRSSDSDLETTHNTFCACLVLLNAFSNNFSQNSSIWKRRTPLSNQQPSSFFPLLPCWPSTWSLLGSSVLAAEFELGDFLTLPVYTNFYLIHTWIFWVSPYTKNKNWHMLLYIKFFYLNKSTCFQQDLILPAFFERDCPRHTWNWLSNTWRIFRSIILCSIVSARTINLDSLNAWSLCTNPLWSPRSFSTSSSNLKQN